ncbi:MAG: hypothetical protein ACXWIU_14555 [Limisphaerales bacterium]
MTGLLVIGTIAVVAFLLVLLGAPGLFLVAGVLFSVERLPQLRIAAKPTCSRPKTIAQCNRDREKVTLVTDSLDRQRG